MPMRMPITFCLSRVFKIKLPFQNHASFFSTSTAVCAKKRKNSRPTTTESSNAPPEEKPRRNKQSSDDDIPHGIRISSTPFLFEKIVHEKTKHIEVAQLAHGLDRVLFNPGVHYLKDPRTNHFNFDESLYVVTQPEDFNFESLPPYKIASGDPILKELALKHKMKYYSSTSSITNLLAQLYNSISLNQELNLSSLSTAFMNEKVNFTLMQRKPTSAILKFYDGLYSVDSEKNSNETPAENEILMQQGKSLEKLLTASPKEYKMHLNSANLPLGHKFPTEEAFHYAKFENFLLRSQLDCYDDRLPGKTFDVKTRATVAIRMDPGDFKNNTDYEITRMKGLISSFEREYYDMARSAMLKYNLQVRIGNMDGIFVCYHNTATIFGFQYISREEMNDVLFGGTQMGDAAFALSIKWLEKILDAAVAKYYGNDIRLTINVHNNPNQITFYAEPMTHPEGEGSLTKFNVSVNRNSYNELRNGDSFENWNIDFDIKETEHHDAPPLANSTFDSTASNATAGNKASDFNEALDAFEGEGEGVENTLSGEILKEQKKEKPAISQIYAEYMSVRNQVPGLNRKSKKSSGIKLFVKRLKTQALELGLRG
ncbi:hypothetical protein HK100_008084 [Physocladia obscura]|uniref:Uncharacterized protein n=1 Tax=Physocladia obscura TaxID=109957 RepID=A0AAD5T4I2_9FUNG|nr:hypothetical protein HK100_008084 [Physocladia obscura]